MQVPKLRLLSPAPILLPISDCLKWRTCNIKVLTSKYSSSSMIFSFCGFSLLCYILKIFNDGYLQNNFLNWTLFFVIVGAAFSPRNGCFSVSSVTGSTFRGSLTLPNLTSFKMSLCHVLFMSFYTALFTIDLIFFPLLLYFMFTSIYILITCLSIYVFYICLVISLFDGVNDYWFIYCINILNYYVLHHWSIHISSLSAKYWLPTPIECISGV